MLCIPPAVRMTWTDFGHFARQRAEAELGIPHDPRETAEYEQKESSWLQKTIVKQPNMHSRPPELHRQVGCWEKERESRVQAYTAGSHLCTWTCHRAGERHPRW